MPPALTHAPYGLPSVRDPCEGTSEISAVTSLFGNPLIAAALGVLLGVSLMVVSHRAVRFVTPGDPMRGMAVVGVLMGARFMVVLAGLAVFYFSAPKGLAPFGIALVFSFVAGLFAEAFRLTAPHAPRTSV